MAYVESSSVFGQYHTLDTKLGKKNNMSLGSNPVIRLLYLPLIIWLIASPVHAARLLLSTTESITIGASTFQDEDLFIYDTDSGVATLFFDGSVEFENQNGLEDVDAVHVRPNGNVVLSTTMDATLGGTQFTDGDLVEYNRSTGTFVGIVFAQSTFNVLEDTNAADILSDGTVILSTSGPGGIGTFAFGRDDLVAYDGTPSIFFDGGQNFAASNENIDAVDVLPNGNIVLSVIGSVTLPGLGGPIDFDDDDLVEFNPSTGVATLFFDGDVMSSQIGIDIDAIQVNPVPVPPAAFLFPAGLIAGLGWMRRRRIE